MMRSTLLLLALVSAGALVLAAAQDATAPVGLNAAAEPAAAPTQQAQPDVVATNLVAQAVQPDAAAAAPSEPQQQATSQPPAAAKPEEQPAPQEAKPQEQPAPQAKAQEPAPQEAKPQERPAPQEAKPLEQPAPQAKAQEPAPQEAKPQEQPQQADGGFNLMSDEAPAERPQPQRQQPQREQPQQEARRAVINADADGSFFNPGAASARPGSTAPFFFNQDDSGDHYRHREEPRQQDRYASTQYGGYEEYNEEYYGHGHKQRGGFDSPVKRRPQAPKYAPKYGGGHEGYENKYAYDPHRGDGPSPGYGYEGRRYEGRYKPEAHQELDRHEAEAYIRHREELAAAAERAERERLEGIAHQREALLTPEERAAIEEYYKKKYAAPEAPKPEAPKAVEVPEAPKPAVPDHKEREEYYKRLEAEEEEKRNYYKYKAGKEKPESYTKYPERHEEEEEDEEEEPYYYGAYKEVPLPDRKYYEPNHNESVFDWFDQDDSYDAYKPKYDDAQSPYHVVDHDDDEGYLDGGHESSFHPIPVAEVIEYYHKHIDTAVCLRDKASTYRLTGTKTKPEKITVELTCCDKASSHKAKHLKKLGVNVPGIDELSVASCQWEFNYFDITLNPDKSYYSSDKAYAVGYATVSCAFNDAAHFCGDIPENMVLSGDGLVFAVPSKTLLDPTIEFKPLPAYDSYGGYSYGGYHKTKVVVVSPEETEVAVASAARPAARGKNVKKALADARQAAAKKSVDAKLAASKGLADKYAEKYYEAPKPKYEDKPYKPEEKYYEAPKKYYEVPKDKHYKPEDKYYEAPKPSPKPYKPEEPYYKEPEYDAYAPQPLGELLLGTSLIVKVPLGKESYGEVKMAGLLEYVVNFYNEEVEIVPDGTELSEGLTTTRRPHKSVKLVTPGKYALMLDEHVPEYYKEAPKKEAAKPADPKYPAAGDKKAAEPEQKPAAAAAPGPEKEEKKAAPSYYY